MVAEEFCDKSSEAVLSKSIALNSAVSDLTRHAIWLRNPASPARLILIHNKTSSYHQDESEVEFLEEFDENCVSDDPLDCHLGNLRFNREIILSPVEQDCPLPLRDVKPSLSDLQAHSNTARPEPERGVATAHDLDQVDQPVGSAAVAMRDFSLAPETMVLMSRPPNQTEDEESELDVGGDDSEQKGANTCEFCGQAFSRAVQRLRHTCKSTFTCSYCAWRGSSRSELLAHEKHLHQTRDGKAKKPLVCTECGARCLTACALGRHAKVHAKGKATCACSGCGANFTTLHSLGRHERECPDLAAAVPGQVQDQTARCRRELDVKPSLTSLKNSQAVADPDGRYICKVCCATFHSKKNVLRHTQTAHTLKFQYKCPTCVASFKSKMALTKHIKVHSQKRPFSCSECRLSFAIRPELLQHLKTHMPFSRRLKGAPPQVHSIKKELGAADEERKRVIRNTTGSDITLADVQVKLTRLVGNPFGLAS